MRIVGVDPGRLGHAVAIDTISGEGWSYKLPFDAQGSIDLAFARWLMAICRDHESIVTLEKLNAAKNDKFGNHTMFKMGFAYGQLDAAIRATMLPSRIVTPQQWQKLFHEGIDTKLTTKEKTILAYQRMFPHDPIPKNPRQKKINDNAVDALFIAQYTAIKFGGGKMIDMNFINLARG